MPVVLSFVLMLFISVSCTTVGFVPSAPVWYEMPESRTKRGQVAFTGNGSGDSKRQAELIAYSAMADNISSYIGSEIGQKYYRELTTKGKISDYSLEMSEIVVTSERPYQAWCLSVADKNVLDGFRTDEARSQIADEQAVRALVHEGDSFMRANRDVDGLKCYIRSMAMSSSLVNLEREYSFESIKNEVFSILDSLSINIVKTDSAEATCTVRVRRKEFLSYSAVVDSPIKASFLAEDVRNEKFYDLFIYKTDNHGDFLFSPLNYTFYRDGSVVFSIDLSQEINLLQYVARETYEQLKTVVDSKSVEFTYSRPVVDHDFAICSVLYTKGGKPRDSLFVSEIISERLKEDTISSEILPAEGEFSDSDFILNSIEKNFPDVEYAVIVLCEAVDDVKSDTEIYAVSVSGEVTLYSMKDRSVVKKSTLLTSNGFGKKYNEAEDSAFAEFAQLAYSIIKANYV